MIKNICALALAFAIGCAPALEDPAQAPVDPAEAEAQTEATLVSGEVGLSGPRLRVTLLDVGQGDGILVQLPGGRTIIVDGGPTKGALIDHLSARGIDSVDYAVLSHAHDDHYSGLTEALALLPKDCRRRVLDPGFDRPGIAGYQSFREAAGCRYGAASPGQSWLIDPAVQIEVVSAKKRPDPVNSDSHGINNTSVVLRLRYGAFSIFLGGDAENETESDMVSQAGMKLRSTVLKLGHHGSCTASGTTFLKAVAPRFVLISAGEGNSYGLPHCQTIDKLKTLRKNGTRWYRTDVNGTISVVSDGTRYYVAKARGAEGSTSCPRDCGDPQDF